MHYAVLLHYPGPVDDRAYRLYAAKLIYVGKIRRISVYRGIFRQPVHVGRNQPDIAGCRRYGITDFLAEPGGHGYGYDHHQKTQRDGNDCRLSPEMQSSRNESGDIHVLLTR